MRLAIIPARGGSKRIPRKNIKLFGNKPMIEYSIDAAVKSGVFDKIIVSTDDHEIAEIAISSGIECPFVRPEELSNDYAGTVEVIAHAIQWALDNGHDVKSACCIYATAPFIQASDLREGAERLETGRWSYVFSATTFEYPIFRSFRQNTNSSVEMFYPEYFTTRSQDLPEAFHDAGQFYFGRPQAWLENKRFFDRWATTVNIPRWRVQDIDTEEDWTRAEMMMEILKRQGLLC
ncbi:pseudaminic acid cytidylyltransferase [Thalassospira tepidiphila]|uniref:pseudaminic acid cytidylyltransferase n=1 Tax=Thalassospira tepidiphila TaxID=393657 RepID=UPI00291F7E57|nr:pseudaminic acid cytidylyltransferase [Thalassospira tepidiphila]